MPKALVVDDEEDICDFLSAMLAEKLGFETGYALSGDEALRLISEGSHDFFLVDLKLSTSVTGLDVIGAAREKCPKATVIAMTGYVDVALMQKAEKLGIKAYFEKPDDLAPDVFERKIRALFPGTTSKGDSV